MKASLVPVLAALLAACTPMPQEVERLALRDLEAPATAKVGEPVELVLLGEMPGCWTFDRLEIAHTSPADPRHLQVAVYRRRPKPPVNVPVASCAEAPTPVRIPARFTAREPGVHVFSLAPTSPDMSPPSRRVEVTY